MASTVRTPVVQVQTTRTYLTYLLYLFIWETSCQFLEYCLSETAVNSEIYSLQFCFRVYVVYHKESQYIAKLRRITIDLYKSRLVTIETPRNHTSSQHRIVFAIIEKYVGIVMNFPISKKGLSFQCTLKLHKNHDLNHFAPTHTLLRRLCPQPPDPSTVGKLRVSAFCMCY